MAERTAIFSHEDLERYLLSIEPELVQMFTGGDLDFPLSLATQNFCYYTTLILANRLNLETYGVLRKSIVSTSYLPSIRSGHYLLSCRTQSGFSYGDGTIWQIRENQKHMNIGGPYENETQLILAVENDYGGDWRMSRGSLDDVQEQSLVGQRGIQFHAQSRRRRS